MNDGGGGAGWGGVGAPGRFVRLYGRVIDYTEHAVPDWLIPSAHGFQADDLDRLAGVLPLHTELIDGSLVFPSRRTAYLDDLGFLLVEALRRTVPIDLRVRREMTVTLGRRQRPEPDLVVVRAQATEDLSATTISRENVVLAVEIVTPESRERDTKRKPLLYAEAGIKHFWLVEKGRGETALNTYELDELTKSYVPTGIYHEKAKLELPYPIEIDFTEADRF